MGSSPPYPKSVGGWEGSERGVAGRGNLGILRTLYSPCPTSEQIRGIKFTRNRVIANIDILTQFKLIYKYSRNLS